jgi:ammonia channel protein AmtB
MALSVILGPRLGKYGPDGKVKVFPAHNLVYVVTGTFILLFGWMGSALPCARPGHLARPMSCSD